jgi:predicted amidohydrolase YtcJ
VEAISIQEAIRLYTAHGPYLTWEEKTKGTLEKGKLADMIVLDSDPLPAAAGRASEDQSRSHPHRRQNRFRPQPVLTAD